MALVSIITGVINGTKAAELDAIRRELTETNANLGAARADAQAAGDTAKLQAINDAIAAHRDAVNAANATITEYNNVVQTLSVVPGVGTIPSVDTIGLMGTDGIVDDVMAWFGSVAGSLGDRLQQLWDTMQAALARMRSAASAALEGALAPFKTIQTGLNVSMALAVVGVGALAIFILTKAGTKEGRAQMHEGYRTFKDLGGRWAKDVGQSTKEGAQVAAKIAPYLV